MTDAVKWFGIAVLVLVLAGCGGSGGDGSDPVLDDEAVCLGDACAPARPAPPEACGADASCDDGFTCVDRGGDDCDPAAGASCPTHCVPVVDPDPDPDPDPDAECRTGDECLADLRCYTCADGQELCPIADCFEGRCFVAMPDCPPPAEPGCGGLLGIACPEGFTCVDVPTPDCPGGMAADCPGRCVPDVEPKCNEDADCPQLRAPCSACPDGSVSCPTSSCVEGLCRVAIGACAEPLACGGDGETCPPGMFCNLDVGDGCWPDASGTNCGGICMPEERPRGCGGIAGIECPPDHACVDDPGDDCDPATGGADCGGVCQPLWERECAADSDCPQIRMACSVCADGTESCPSSTCEGGRCAVNYPSCPFPGECHGDAECKPGYHCGYHPLMDCAPRPDGSCPMVCLPDQPSGSCGGFAGTPCAPGFVCTDDPADECDPNLGGADCPGVCEPESTPECRAEADCPHILGRCAPCADGSYACPKTWCSDGRCGVSIGSCPDTSRCGGIAGFPCSPGFTCIDDPADDCDPDQGGADCGGICVIDGKPLQCREDSDCLQIQAPCRLCADGSAACPRSYCADGECRGEIDTCADSAG